MKLSILIPLCAVSVLGHLLSYQDAHIGICGVRVVPSLLDLNPVCRLDALTSDGATEHVLGEWPSCSGNGTGCGGGSWTRASPCLKSHKDERQYCAFSDSTFAENRGIGIVTTPKRAAHLARNPAFTDPIVTKGTNQDIVQTIPAKYQVVPVEGKGMGAIATRLINRGELIMANTASLMVDYGAFTHLDTEEYMQLQAELVDSLPEKHRALVLNLSTHDEANFTHVELVGKVLSTNAFDIEPDPTDEEQHYSFYALFPEIARMNHDCRANADYYYDPDSLTQYIHAIRPILPGEEITISYLNPLLTRRRRAKRLLRNWGFGCGCAACTASAAAGHASDARVEQIARLAAELEDYSSESRATPQMAELHAALLEQEGLWGLVYQAYAFAAIEWNGVGEPWTATKFAHLAVDYGIHSVGPSDRDVIEMATLAEDPWNHWSWMLRTKRRMGWGVREEKEA